MWIADWPESVRNEPPPSFKFKISATHSRAAIWNCPHSTTTQGWICQNTSTSTWRRSKHFKSDGRSRDRSRCWSSYCWNNIAFSQWKVGIWCTRQSPITTLGGGFNTFSLALALTLFYRWSIWKAQYMWAWGGCICRRWTTFFIIYCFCRFEQTDDLLVSLRFHCSCSHDFTFLLVVIFFQLNNLPHCTTLRVQKLQPDLFP